MAANLDRIIITGAGSGFQGADRPGRRALQLPDGFWVGLGASTHLSETRPGASGSASTCSRASPWRPAASLSPPRSTSSTWRGSSRSSGRPSSRRSSAISSSSWRACHRPRPAAGRVWHPLVMWNPHSVMFEVGWCVTLYTSVLALEFSPLVFERFKLTGAAEVPEALSRSRWSSRASCCRSCTSRRSAASS